MKAAFYSYPSAFQNPGGGEIQLLKTREALEALGVEVKLFDQWKDRLEDYDVFHVFGSVKDCVGLMQSARSKNVKVALSSIFWSSFTRAIYEGGGIRKKGELFARHLLKTLCPFFPSGRRKTMQLSDIIFPNSCLEKQQLVRFFGIDAEKIMPVPNGIDPKFLEAESELFLKKYGLNNFVLAVGRIEPRKNQLNLIKAMKGTGLKLVIVGDPVSDYMGYYKECRSASGDDVLFLDGMGHEDEMLPSAYAACKIFAAPGWFETPGLAALEAAAGGAAIAITKFGCTKEYFEEDALYFDPSDVGDIRKNILKAGEISHEAKNRLKERIKNNYLWANVAKKTLEGYESILRKDGK